MSKIILPGQEPVVERTPTRPGYLTGKMRAAIAKRAKLMARQWEHHGGDARRQLAARLQIQMLEACLTDYEVAVKLDAEVRGLALPETPKVEIVSAPQFGQAVEKALKEGSEKQT